jgi:hypothetical protein
VPNYRLTMHRKPIYPRSMADQVTAQRSDLPDAAADASSAADRPAPPRRRATRPLLTAALLVSLIGIVTYLLVAFQPFASAAGGCGGG